MPDTTASQHSVCELHNSAFTTPTSSLINVSHLTDDFKTTVCLLCPLLGDDKRRLSLLVCSHAGRQHCCAKAPPTRPCLQLTEADGHAAPHCVGDFLLTA